MKRLLVLALVALVSSCTVTSITTPHDNSCSNGGCCGMLCSQKPIKQSPLPADCCSQQQQVTVMVVPGVWSGIKVDI